jgi:hypothetical protein
MSRLWHGWHLVWITPLYGSARLGVFGENWLQLRDTRVDRYKITQHWNPLWTTVRVDKFDVFGEKQETRTLRFLRCPDVRHATYPQAEALDQAIQERAAANRLGMLELISKF